MEYIGLTQKAHDFIKENFLYVIDEASDKFKVYEDLEGNIYREMPQLQPSTTRGFVFTYLIKNNKENLFRWKWIRDYEYQVEYNPQAGEIYL